MMTRKQVADWVRANSEQPGLANLYPLPHQYAANVLLQAMFKHWPPVMLRYFKTATFPDPFVTRKLCALADIIEGAEE